jgi:hypothetical protein
MIDLRFVPLDLANFPGGARKTRRASTAFSSTYQRTLERLEYELEKLKAIDVVVQAGYDRQVIRNDGWPRSSATPRHPAVVLTFRSRESNQQYSFPCDTFTRFEHNLHAIAFTLEALRAVNRYGVTRGHEQYKGFAQIESAKPWNVEDAAQFVAAKTGCKAEGVIEMASYYREAYRIAAKMLHPDTGGNPHEWKLLADAKALLDFHHGLTAEQRIA